MVVEERFKGGQFPKRIVLQAVYWYLRYSLSYRDIEELMGERGVVVDHSTVQLFARDPHVPFTNNRAERDLRMAKVKQKISGCFRKEQYALAYCRISSYLQTMASRGVNPLVAIQIALAGKALDAELDRGE